MIDHIVHVVHQTCQLHLPFTTLLLRGGGVFFGCQKRISVRTTVRCFVIKSLLGHWKWLCDVSPCHHLFTALPVGKRSLPAASDRQMACRQYFTRLSVLVEICSQKTCFIYLVLHWSFSFSSLSTSVICFLETYSNLGEGKGCLVCYTGNKYRLLSRQHNHAH